MKQILVFLLGTFLFILFAGYLFTYRVNFDETVLVTTFGKAGERSVKNSEGNGAGLYFKWPWPVQKVTRFDRRIIILEDRLEQQETKDKQVVIVKAFTSWRITDALGFHRFFKTFEQAEEFLRERLRSAKAEIGNFSFEELTNADPAKLRIDDAEKALLQRTKNDLEKHHCGIEIRTVGISRILLPENITRTVFSRMKQTRHRMAQNTRSEGKAVAKSIMAKTGSDKRRILAFTERMAQNIRAQGDAAAAQYYKEYSKNKNFAIFLRKLEALEKSLSKNTTFILDTDTEPFDLLKEMEK
ncbi:MAG: hypothetical protein GF401_17600 [Chitinivibrionales bacterium]|nr:hypothetical protein [Chitinivibrionales bacterium]